MEKQNEVLQLQDLTERIEKWSVNLGLHTNSFPKKQNFKLKEELGELSRAIQKGDKLGQMDGLGDTIVVCGVMATQIRKYATNPNEILGSKINIPTSTFTMGVENEFYRFDKTVERFLSYCEDSYQQMESGSYMQKMYQDLIASAYYLSLALQIDLLECVKMAYSTIHFRSGEIVDGVFVKRDPQALITVPTEILKEDIDTIIKSVLVYTENNGLDFFKVNFSLESKHISHS